MDLIHSVTAKVKQVLSPTRTTTTMPPKSKAKKEEPKKAAAKKAEPKKAAAAKKAPAKKEPAKKDDKKTPAKKDDKKTPAKKDEEVKKEEPKKEEPKKADTKKTPAKKDDKKAPAKKDDKKKTTAKEEEAKKEEEPKKEESKDVAKKEEPKKTAAAKKETKKGKKDDDKKDDDKKDTDEKKDGKMDVDDDKKDGDKDDKMDVDEGDKKEDDKKEDDKKKDDKKDTKKKTPAKKETKKRPAADSGDKQSKRARKERDNLEPEDFTMKEPEGIKINPGRGAKLGTFPSVKASIENSKHTAEEIAFAHQFLFGKKGKFTKKEMKTHLLEFSGYLKPIPSGKKRTDKEVEKEEEAMETKFSKKAFALKKDQIVDLCNFFAVTLEPTKEEPKMDKETCIDRLLDFLGTPNKDWLVDSSSKKTPKKAASAEKKSPAKKATPTATPKAKVVSAPKNDYTKIKSAAGKKKMPSDDVLRAWVRTYVACFNSEKATAKHAIATCAEKFGVDMSSKKKEIKAMIGEEL